MTLKQYIDFITRKKNKATDQELLNCMWIEKYCLERKNMPNIKITAEVDGKQVPLENISTETFEAIKALEKSKEIPVARLGMFDSCPRLIFKPSINIQLKVGKIYALALDYGDIGAHWLSENDNDWINQYSITKSL